MQTFLCANRVKSWTPCRVMCGLLYVVAHRPATQSSTWTVSMICAAPRLSSKVTAMDVPLAWDRAARERPLESGRLYLDVNPRFTIVVLCVNCRASVVYIKRAGCDLPLRFVLCTGAACNIQSGQRVNVPPHSTPWRFCVQRSTSTPGDAPPFHTKGRFTFDATPEFSLFACWCRNVEVTLLDLYCSK